MASCRFIVLLGHLSQFGNQRDVAEQQYAVIVGVCAVEVGTAQVFVVQGLLQAFHLIHVGDDGVGKGDAVPCTVPEALHGVPITAIRHTGSRSDEVGKVCLYRIGIGLGIQADIGHKVEGSHRETIAVPVHQHFLQSVVAHGQGRFQTRFGGIGV